VNAIKRFFQNKNTVTVIGVVVAIAVLYIGYNWRVQSAINPVLVPYATQDIKGGTQITSEMIGTIEVPANAPRKATTYKVAVPEIEGLKGKHAIYLVAEGPEIQQPQNERRQFGNRPQQPQRPVGLFDLHGIGFSKNGTTCEPPVVPTVDILVDGKKLNMSNTPIRCSNANGLTDAIRYQIYGPLTANSKITVSPSNPAVKSVVSQIVEGRATVKCTYNGQTKIYLIN
jgi:hypothetical protein